MAIYEFQAVDGEVIEVFMTFDEHDKRVKDGKITLDDGRVAKTYWGNSTVKTYSGNYPMVCSAAGVAPSQIKAHVEHLRQMGCGTVEHTRDGDVVFADKAQRKKICEALGLYDRRASYGDPQPKHRTKNSKSFIR